MASARDVRAGKAVVELGVDDKITAGLNRAAKKFKAFGASVMSMGLKVLAGGTVLAGGIGVAAKVFANMGSEIFDASKRTGAAVDQLSALKYAAEQSGASLEDLERGIKFMQRQGIGADQFEALAKEVNGMVDPTAKAARAMKLWGKSGTSLIPMLDGLSAAMQRARDLGLVISPEEAAAADVFGDSLHELWMQMKMVTFQVGAAVAKAFLPFAEATARCMKTIIVWTKNNPKLVLTFAAVSVAIVALGGVMVAVGAVAISTAVVFSTLATAITFLLSPVGLTLVAVVALTAAMLKFTSVGTVAMNVLRAIGAIAQDTFQGIADALMSGNIELAGKIMFAGLKVVWLEGIATLRSAWNLFLSEIEMATAGILSLPGIDSGAKELFEAVDELKRLRAEAAKGVPAAAGRRRTPAGGDMEDMLDKAEKNSGMKGIFNSAAIRSLASSPVQDRIAKAAERTARNTDKLVTQGVGLA